MNAVKFLTYEEAMRTPKARRLYGFPEVPATGCEISFAELEELTAGSFWTPPELGMIAVLTRRVAQNHRLRRFDTQMLDHLRAIRAEADGPETGLEFRRRRLRHTELDRLRFERGLFADEAREYADLSRFSFAGILGMLERPTPKPRAEPARPSPSDADEMKRLGASIVRAVQAQGGEPKRFWRDLCAELRIARPELLGLEKLKEILKTLETKNRGAA